MTMPSQDGHKYIDGVDGDIAALSARVDELAAVINAQGAVIAAASADAFAAKRDAADAIALTVALDDRLAAVEQLLASEPWNTTPPPPPPVLLGFASYTEADRAKWTMTHPQYPRLAGSWAGNVNRTTDVVPATIPQPNTTQSANMVNASIWVKAQGLLWSADGNALRLQRATEKIDAFVAIAQVAPSDDEFRLPLSWALNNLVQAAWIIGYPKAKLEPLLTWAVPHMDWWGGPNWHAGFAAVRAMIAGYRGDPVAMADAVDYLDYRIPQSLYLSAHDGPNVRGVAGTSNRNNPATMWPGVKADTTLDPAATKIHWWNQTNGSNFVLINPADGADGERTRDLSHENMGMKSWLDAVLAVKANGGVVPTHVIERLRAHIAYHAPRVLAWLKTGTTPAPVPVSGQGGEALFGGWYTAKKFYAVYGGTVPAALTELLTRTEVSGWGASGSNQISAEAFAEGTY